MADFIGDTKEAAIAKGAVATCKACCSGSGGSGTTKQCCGCPEVIDLLAGITITINVACIGTRTVTAGVSITSPSCVLCAAPGIPRPGATISFRYFLDTFPDFGLGSNFCTDCANPDVTHASPDGELLDISVICQTCGVICPAVGEATSTGHLWYVVFDWKVAGSGVIKEVQGVIPLTLISCSPLMFDTAAGNAICSSDASPGQGVIDESACTVSSLITSLCTNCIGTAVEIDASE